MTFEKIDNVLKLRTMKLGIHKEATAARICFEAEKLYGHEFKTISFKDGILTISAKNNIEAQEIRFRQLEIIEKINSKIGINAIKRLKYRVS